MRSTKRTLTCLAMALAASALLARGVSARQGAQGSASASVIGTVIEAGSGQPLAAALVTLEPAPRGLLVDTRSPMLAAGRTVETGPGGGYHFTDVAPGLYRLRVERLGYRGAVVEVEVRRPVDARISVGLDLEPVLLEPVEVREQALPPFRRVAGDAFEPAAARTTLERERQRIFVTSDARALTYADLVEGVTLGETDVFRALQRFPGVATRDDYTAELWTRGAPWSQTRVTFDDMPLFNPVHAVGVFSAVAPEILGAVFFEPGYRSAASGEGAAGLVDLRSRPGGGNGELRGAADVSMASAKLALDQQPSDRVAWIVAARRSWLSVLRNSLDWLDLEQVELPYEFHDVSGRLDVQLDDVRALEFSGLWEQDRLFGDVEGILEGTTANWGNTTSRVTLHAPLGSLRAKHTIGVSHYRSHVQESGDSTPDGRPGPWTEPPADNRVLYLRLGTELTPDARAGTIAPWSAGYEVVLQDTHYDGPRPRFHPVRPDTTRRVFREEQLWNAGAWAEARFTPGRLTIVPGLRIEAGSRIADYHALTTDAVATRGAAQPAAEHSVRFAPRLAVRYGLTSDLSVSAAVSRSWQYLQAIALAGPSAHPLFHASQFWLLAGESAPAIRSDVLTVGAEQWLGSGWLVSASGWTRDARGLALPDPRPGLLEGRPLFVVGENHARGVEFGVRRVAGRVTASFGYTLGTSDIEAAGLSYPATTDRRERVDATAAVRIGRALRVGGAWTAMSGAPYTRVTGRIRSADCVAFGFGCEPFAPRVESPNERRTPAYRAFDLIATVSQRVRGIEASAYVQLRNVLGHDNAVTYTGSYYTLRQVSDRAETEVKWHDRFEAGLPRLPLLGARITF